ncbi:MAG: hypothetical protein V8T45_04845 [Oscillospiraceae bacterium]
MWKETAELNDMYEAALCAERARCRLFWSRPGRRMPVTDYREHSRALAKIINLRRKPGSGPADSLSYSAVVLLVIVLSIIFGQVFS